MSHPAPVTLACDESLKLAGCSSVFYSLSQAHSVPSTISLRRQAADCAAEIALRRWLATEGVPFQVQRASPFSLIDRGLTQIAGCRVLVISRLIQSITLLRELACDPSKIYSSEFKFQIPSTQERNLREGDLIFFSACGFLPAKTNPSAYFPISLASEKHWIAPHHWAPFRNLTITSQEEDPLEVELLGKRADGREIHLSGWTSRQKAFTAGNYFYSLIALHADRSPQAPLFVSRRGLKIPWRISTRDWLDLQFCNQEIIFAGWLTLHEVKTRSIAIAHSPSEHFPSALLSGYYAIKANDLRGLEELSTQGLIA
jgi:hypothetical protein